MIQEHLKCLRCGKHYTDPIPTITNPEGAHTEIATTEWCADCNRLAAIMIYRQSSVYFNLYTKKGG